MLNLKKIIIFTISLCSLFIFIPNSYADSPLTSTDFYKAYLDIPIVKESSEGKINLRIAEFLSSAENPIDVKVAVVNALGWKFEGKYNSTMYQYYLSFIHNVKADRLDPLSLSPDEMLTIGYLTALDDYFHPEQAIPLVEKAVKMNNKSFTFAMIQAIIKAQTIDVDKWGGIWQITEDVLNKKELKIELRQEAINIITDYMILYKNYNK